MSTCTERKQLTSCHIARPTIIITLQTGLLWWICLAGPRHYTVPVNRLFYRDCWIGPLEMLLTDRETRVYSPQGTIRKSLNNYQFTYFMCTSKSVDSSRFKIHYGCRFAYFSFIISERSVFKRLISSWQGEIHDLYRYSWHQWTQSILHLPIACPLLTLVVTTRRLH
jgi:hypothetical protein